MMSRFIKKFLQSIASKIERFVSHQHTFKKNSSNWIETDELTTTIPFVKNNEFNYKWLIGGNSNTLGSFHPTCYIHCYCCIKWCQYDDGLDGTGTSAIIENFISCSSICNSHAISQII